jgi:uroporphyrinogen decarboxylase
VREKIGTAVALDQKGRVRDRDSLSMFPTAPPVPAMIEAVDHYLDYFKDTSIGIGIVCRSVFCNTYETLGMENFLYKLYDDIGFVEEVMDRFLAYSLEIANAVSEKPIDVFFLDDDIAINSGLLVSRQLLDNLWVPRTSQLLEPLHKRGIPVVMHCCGNLSDVMPMILDLGVQGVHPIQPTCNDIYELKHKYGEEICLIGNMDLAGVLTQGTPEDVARDTKEHIDRLAPGGGYVVGSSHSITNDVPPENYMAMIETAWTYGKY